MQNLQDQIDQIRSDVMSLTEAVANLRSFCYEMGNAAPAMDCPVVSQDEVRQVMASVEVPPVVQKLEMRPKVGVSSLGVNRPDETGQMNLLQFERPNDIEMLESELFILELKQK